MPHSLTQWLDYFLIYAHIFSFLKSDFRLNVHYPDAIWDKGWVDKTMRDKDRHVNKKDGHHSVH